MREVLRLLLLRLLLLAAVVWLASAEKANGSGAPPPKPPVYPPRWTITADFKFFDVSDGLVVAVGVVYQVVDSVTLKMRADDLYFAGTFAATTYDVGIVTNKSDIYARLERSTGRMNCTNYEQGNYPISQHWLQDWCTYNATVYHGATEAYRWFCAVNKVS